MRRPVAEEIALMNKADILDQCLTDHPKITDQNLTTRRSGWLGVLWVFAVGAVLLLVGSGSAGVLARRDYQVQSAYFVSLDHIPEAVCNDGITFQLVSFQTVNFAPLCL
jgi:hypothetical protein